MGKSKLRFASLLAWTVQTSDDSPVMRRADFNNLLKAKGHKSCVLSLNSSHGYKVPMHHCAFESCPQLHNINVFCVTEVWVLLETLHTESGTFLKVREVIISHEPDFCFCWTKVQNSYLCHIVQAVKDVLASLFRFDPRLCLMVLRCLEVQKEWPSLKHWRSTFKFRNNPITLSKIIFLLTLLLF